MVKAFVITTTTQRTLSELASYHEQAAQLEPALMILGSRNFHWLELKMRDEMTRIEAIRTHPQPDREHEWKWPHSFRVIHDKKGRRTEQEVERGHRGKGIYAIEICGVRPDELSLLTVMRRKSFVSFSFQVGRQTKMITPQEAERRETPVFGGKKHSDCYGGEEQYGTV